MRRCGGGSAVLPGIAPHIVRLAVLFLMLAGCAAQRTLPPASLVPKPRGTPPAEAPRTFDTSRELAAHYRRVEAIRRAQGRLRTRDSTADGPVSEAELVENFLRVALFEELTDDGTRLVAREREGVLRRWPGPVRLGLSFAGVIPAQQAEIDRAAVASYASRLTRITGNPVTLEEQNPNFHVLIADEAARRAVGPRLRTIFPEITDAAIAEIENLPRSTYCLVAASDAGGDGTYEVAVAIIRAEQPDLMRLSCLHEEIAQGLGLVNDSPDARPSIFNDDEEFATLTRHDELLLRILYDPRLEPGMDAEAAMPVVREIVTGLLAGPS